MSEKRISWVVHPYHSQAGQSLLDWFVTELSGDRWHTVQIAVAFLRQSGNFRQLIEAMQKFLERGGKITLIAGADSFNGQAEGSDYEAAKGILLHLGTFTEFSLFLYHEKARRAVFYRSRLLPLAPQFQASPSVL